VNASADSLSASANKHQSNPVKGGIIARLFSPGGSSSLQVHVLAESATPKSPFPLRDVESHSEARENILAEPLLGNLFLFF